MVDIMPEEKHGFYVEFELRAVDDREQTVKAGHPVFKDIEVAIITMPGGSLVVDKVVTDELLREWKTGIPGRKPASPFAISAYEAWKDGREAPVNGTDLRNWPGVTPAQLKMCQGCTIRSVEDLAAANADAIRKMGMGAVALKDKAASWLESAGTNKNSEEVSALKVEMKALKEAIATKDAKIDTLMEQLTAPDDAPAQKRGRAKKAA